mmetsp:Transcript_12752/g.24399  ORF Transcript_12752/g.24399 Transcript_12752/m.24399 type:complete len:142 (+) Transcript_12752:2169-2594(+)
MFILSSQTKKLSGKDSLDWAFFGRTPPRVSNASARICRDSWTCSHTHLSIVEGVDPIRTPLSVNVKESPVLGTVQGAGRPLQHGAVGEGQGDQTTILRIIWTDHDLVAVKRMPGEYRRLVAGCIEAKKLLQVWVMVGAHTV